MNTKKKFFILIIFSIFTSWNNIYAQCCAAGNPVSTNSFSTTEAIGKLNISLSHMYSYSDTYYKGNSISDYIYIDNSFFNFSSIALDFGISENLKLTADIGYFLNKYQKFDFGENFKPEREATGLGDATFGILYKTFHSDDNTFQLFQTAMLTLPVGEFDQVNNSVLLPIDIQPSSGNYKYNLGLMMVKTFQDLNNFSLVSFNTMEISQFIETDRTNYKYGNQFNISLIGMFSEIFQNVDIGLQLRCNIRQKALAGTKNKDDKISYNFLESTGGIVLFTSPQISYNFFDQFKMTFIFDLPIYKDMNGLQLTNKYAATMKFSKGIDFLPAEAIIQDYNLEEKNLSLVFIKVDGACGMCKNRIENLTDDFKYVEGSEWDSDTKTLKIAYSLNKPNIDEIQKALADIGHDNDLYRASEKAYNDLHECCKYR